MYVAWCVQHMEERVVFCKLEEIGRVVSIEKAVIINKNSTVVAKGKVVPDSSYTIHECAKLSFTTLNDTAPFLHLIGSLDACTGFDSGSCPPTSTSKTAVKSGRIWRSKTCAVLSAKAMQCKKAKKKLQCRQKRRSRKSKYVPITSALLETIRATVLREKYKRELLSLKRNMSSDPSNALLNKVLSELQPLQRLAFRTALQSTKAKSSRGVRYDYG